jgi:hypothetical protein
VNTSPIKCKSVHISPQCVDSALGPIIRNRPVKTVAHAAGRSAEAVKKWRKTALPEAWAALINLLTLDDEVYLAVMELADRKPTAALTNDQKRAVSEALKLLGVE